MKKQTTKLVGVCAAALLTISAVTPATATIFGQGNGVASAAELSNGYLANPARYEVGTFNAADFSLLSGQTTTFTTDQKLEDMENVAGGTGGTAGIVKQLFPGASNETTILEALGLSQYATSQYSIEMKANQNFANLYNLNQFKGNISVSFTMRDGNGGVIATVSTVLQVQSYEVSVENIVANLGDDYDITDNISGTNPFGVDMTVKAVETAPTSAEDITTPNEIQVFVPETQPVNYFDPAVYVDAELDVYNKLLDKGLPQLIQIYYVNGNGQLVQKNVTRNISINATAETTPILQVKADQGPFNTDVYYTNGQKVGVEYAFQMDALNQAPLGGGDDYIKDNVWGTTPAKGFKILNDNNATPDKFVLVPFGGSKGGKVASLYREQAIDLNDLTGDQDISVDASKVDFTKAGTYYYTVSVTNEQNVTASFELPLIIKTNAKAPTYKFAPGHSADMTIKKGDTFKPFEGLTFYQTDDTTDGTITQDNITIKGSVNTNVPGTYTLVYTATNNLGLTVTVNRTITVTDGTVQKDVPIYRLYNAGNGHHMFTKSFDEYTWLKTQGWTQEGMAWESPSEGSPVYRLYNPVTGEHLFTMDLGEYNWLPSQGWKQEGTAFYSAPAATGNPVYRLYNPITGLHFYTQSEKEYNWLPSQGWKQEGPSFYGVGK